MNNYDDDVCEKYVVCCVFQVEELKLGGRDIAVTNNNVIEYIHLMADYRLNKQVGASLQRPCIIHSLCASNVFALLFCSQLSSSWYKLKHSVYTVHGL